MPLKIGDRATAQGFPLDYPLVVLAIVGGRVAIGSPRWPKGANPLGDSHPWASINGLPVAFPKTQTNTSRQRKAA